MSLEQRPSLTLRGEVPSKALRRLQRFVVREGYELVLTPKIPAIPDIHRQSGISRFVHRITMDRELAGIYDWDEVASRMRINRTLANRYEYGINKFLGKILNHRPNNSGTSSHEMMTVERHMGHEAVLVDGEYYVPILASAYISPFVLQVINGEKINLLSQSQQVREEVYQAVRGNITFINRHFGFSLVPRIKENVLSLDTSFGGNVRISRAPIPLHLPRTG